MCKYGGSMKENILVVFGGKSVEHDISIITALQVMRFLDKDKNVIPLYIQRNGKWCVGENFDKVDTFIDFDKKAKVKREVFLKIGKPYLYIKQPIGFKKTKIDCALMCLHGGAGENGEVASVFDMCDIPFTSSSSTSSGVTMDKIFAKQILESEGIRNVPFVYFSKNEFENSESKVLSKIKNFGFPVIVKPANLGSSVAIEVARTKEEFLEATKVALEFDDRILVERFLEGAEEYNCAVFEFDKNVKTSKVVKVDKGEIFSFDEKYLQKEEQKSQKTSKNIENEIKKLSKQIYKLFDLKGVVRIDFLLYEEKLFVNEVNSIPGSLSINMFSGISKREFVEKLIENGKQKSEEKKRLTYHYDSKALQIFKDEIGFAKSRK